MATVNPPFTPGEILLEACLIPTVIPLNAMARARAKQRPKLLAGLKPAYTLVEA